MFQVLTLNSEPETWDSRGHQSPLVMTSRPPIYERRTSGTTIDPSFC